MTTKIYISATYSDLKEYRAAAYRILRKLRHNVISMEDYVATDAYPLHKCLEDVAACDVYIGVLGWHYGYIPDKDNPENKSITELEYHEADKCNLPCLIFLSDRDAPWPDIYRDSVTGEGEQGKLVTNFRAELEAEYLVSYFKTPDQLGRCLWQCHFAWAFTATTDGTNYGKPALVLVTCLPIGLAVGITVALVSTLVEYPLDVGLRHAYSLLTYKGKALVFGLVYGLSVWIILGLVTGEVEPIAQPNQRNRRTVRSASCGSGSLSVWLAE